MSLRSRILAVYLPVSLAPLLLVGGANYARNAEMSERLLGAELAGTTEEAARYVAARYSGLQQELLRELLAGEVVEAGATPFHRIEVHEAGGGVRLIRAGEFVAAAECEAAANEVRIRVALTAGGDGAAGVALGTTSLERVIPAPLIRRTRTSAAHTLVVDRESGGMLYDPACPSRTPSTALLTKADGTSVDVAALAAAMGAFEYEESGRARTAAYTRLTSPPWTVVTSAPKDALNLTWQSAATALALLLFGLVGALIFHLLTGRLLRSLKQVIHAADRIGEGDFTPWLPPPGDDETGRLSHALGSMVVRLKRLMRERERSRQLAVVGEVSSHLAHEIRNPLSAMTLNLQSVRREIRRGTVPADLKQVLDVCLDEIGRLETVVENVLRLGRPVASNGHTCGLHEVVNGALALMTHELAAKRIGIERYYLASQDTVRCDAEQMRGLVLNLLRNAGQAMPGGGTVRIWTAMVMQEPGPPLIRLHVADQGPGVPPELRERIFEPFFTTKPNGSGIGLASGAATAEAAGGRLYVEKRSELERGAEFVLELPLAPPAQPTQERRREAGRRRSDRTQVTVPA